MEPASIAIATVKVALAKLGGIKAWSLLSFIGGVAVTLGFEQYRRSEQHGSMLRAARCITLTRAKWTL